ncbi:hypothetical protein [Chryseobacterium populi]|uniref:Lipoprotein n=1 Tax=Chryseobacterium populi TaxID=1144316 RepID=J2KLG2_9FLAO|nr:hypothetical protein [Chryseobacterium populi]EJL73913.1 hypothetical protein PMI13_01341 [Chryseobacterium populi]
MNYKMYFKIPFLLLIVTTIISCSNKKAADFKKSITDKKSEVYNMLLGEKGLESRKLDYLIKQDYSNALLLVDQQETKFNSVIKDIEMLNPDGIEDGKQVQKAAVDYYRILKKLFLCSRDEIEQQVVTRSKSDEKKISAAQDRILEVLLEKQKLYQQLYEKDELLFKALKQFDDKNGLK